MKTGSPSPILVAGVVLALILCCWPEPAVAAQETERDEPLDLGLEERIEVQFVLVDFLVLDRRGRTVPDLTIDDFELLVDGKLTEIATLDHDCPEGAAPDPRVAAKQPDPVPRPTERPPAQPQRIVLVFDYFHMSNLGETFDRALDMLDTWPTGDEEHMIVSLGQVVRIEIPFTKDLDELRWTLRRMRNDRGLYAGNTSRLTELRFFRRIAAMFDILERWSGRKSLVLFSGSFQPDGFHHDPQYRELSGLSAATRTAIYPVDTAGLQAYTPFGGPPELRRLANETGGRMTSETNDISLAYANAQRDLSCMYTIGFYNPRGRLDDNRRLTLRVAGRGGVRVVYPEFYVVRSPEQKRESLVRTAAMVPHMFESDEVDTELFVLRPGSPTRWRTVLGVEVRLGPGEVVGEGEQWQLEGFLRKPNGTVVRSFTRSVPMPATDATRGRNSVVTMFHELAAPPGEYAVSVVLVDPEGDTPRAATRPITLAKIPRKGPFLIGPILGHRSTSEEAAVRRDRTGPAFRPLVSVETERGDPLDSLTVLCVAGDELPDAMRTIARWITTPDGADVHRFDDVSVRLAGEARVSCHELLDPVATTTLQPGRYEINASVETLDFETDAATAGFAVRSATDEPDAER